MEDLTLYFILLLFSDAKPFCPGTGTTTLFYLEGLHGSERILVCPTPCSPDLRSPARHTKALFSAVPVRGNV